MAELIAVSIGIGLAVSLLFSEVFGLAAGGMVVPGYFAVYLNRPIDVTLTILCALATYFIVHLLSTFIIIYGRRRTVLMILVGYLMGSLIRWSMVSVSPMFTTGPAGEEAANSRVDLLGSLAYTFGPGQDSFELIGYIIPGLVAIWIDRQGLVETLGALASAAVVVRLILILIYGVQLNSML